jgi:CRP-like cAMP-binding protein
LTDQSSPLAPFVAKLQKCVNLSQADSSALYALPYTLRNFDPGSYLYREGERPSHCFIIVSGFAAGQKIVRNGSRQIVDILLRGDAVDPANALIGVTNHGVQVLTRLQAALVPLPTMSALVAANPAVARAIWIQTLVHTSIQREWTANVGRRDARTRIAHLLCELGIRQEEAGVCPRDNYELPMTQEQLADATGLTSVHVNRVLGNLRAEGIIGGRNRHVFVPDWGRLTSVGDFRTNYLRCEVNAA